MSLSETPLKVAVTGAAGQIAYSLLFRLGAGELAGRERQIELRLLEIPDAISRVRGVAMELQDCAFPALSKLTVTSDADEAFADVDAAFLIGAKPRGPGMERSDLLTSNAAIFAQQGRSLNRVASASARILVVGNPANTNALVLARNAPDLPKEAISAMMRLDQNRAIGMLADKLGVTSDRIGQVAIWGNHSPTMVVDLRAATLDGEPLMPLMEQGWYRDTLLPQVAGRGGSIIEARGASSAASAASAALEHMRDWLFGSDGRWVSMAIPTSGRNGLPDGLICGVPVIIDRDGFTPATCPPQDGFLKALFARTIEELEDERSAILGQLLG